jgi:hypothetical protein
MLKIICAAVLAGGLVAALPATPALSAASKKESAEPAVSGRTAARERQRRCGAEWREAKAAGKVEKAMTWPKYWSACNKRLKAQGA